MKDYIKKLKDLREDNDNTQTEIAKLLNIKQTNYSKYERGDLNISIDQLIILCKYYNVTPNFVLGFDQ